VEAADGRPGRGPNKLVVYGGAGAAAVALLGVGLLLGRSGTEETPKDTGKEEGASASSAAASKKEEKKKEEEAKTEEAKAESQSSASPSASASAKKVAIGPEPTSKKETPTPGRATTTAAKEPKKEEAAPAVGTAPFSVSAAQVALTQAATNSAGCKKPDGPTGSGKVQVTFATSGRVTTANVQGPPFAGTPVGGCVAGVFRRAKVPPFAGNPVTVSKSFAIK
jgi:cytoskeletal protein RodZ